VLELVHQENPISSYFIPIQSFVNEKYIVTVLLQPLHFEEELIELFFEVRSTTDFSLIYCSPKDCGINFKCFSFAEDIFAVQMLLRTQKDFIR